MNPRPDPKLIRLHADGELSPEQSAHWEQYLKDHPQEADAFVRQVEAETELRERVAQVMKGDPAPTSLRAGIRSAFAETLLSSEESHTEIAGSIRPQAPAARRSIFSDPQRANILAIAATLALVAGAVLYGIFGRSIDDVTPRRPADLVSEAAQFADREHGVKPRLESTSPATAEAYLSDWLGAPVHVFDLSDAGYEFVGASQCGMPVPARSGRLTYRKSQNQGGPYLSVFIVQDGGGCKGKLCEGMDTGKWVCTKNRAAKCKRRVLQGTDGQLVYFLVCCDDGEIDRLAQHIQLACASSMNR